MLRLAILINLIGALISATYEEVNFVLMFSGFAITSALMDIANELGEQKRYEILMDGDANKEFVKKL